MAIKRIDRVQTVAVALALTCGVVGAAGVAAQETPPAADEPVVVDPVETEDEGFDDWGLLGLLGLGGLLGLRRQPARPVMVEERVTATETRRP